MAHPNRINPMMFNVVITGGAFYQNQNNTHNRGLELLQAATSPAAFHDSGERYDPPKCHPSTRVAVMNAITDWMLSLDEESRGKFIMWLTGAAGAGKSAILQSFAEQQDSEGCLLASFFFEKTDPDRDNSRKLVATIAYQIHKNIPDVRRHMISAVEEDPLIFTRSLFTQFTILIIQPLQAALLLESRFFDQPRAPRLIVVDGLDECINRREQEDILLTISRITQQHQLPVIFLISSRPEHDINISFSSPPLRNISTRLDLDERFSADNDNDIEVYIRHEFDEIKANHPFRRSIPSSWPSEDVIRNLVQKSSGQFIYAATVVKYVRSSRHRPQHRLEVVVNLRHAGRSEERPFAELDALYSHILLGVVEDSISVVLHVLCFVFYDSYDLVSNNDLEAVLQLDDDAIEVAFCDLSALVSIVTESSDDKRSIKILHASLRDFLFDEARSQAFYMKYDYLQDNAIQCLRFVANGCSLSRMDAFQGALYFFSSNCHDGNLQLEDPLLDELQSFSIPLCYSGHSQPAIMGFDSFHSIFLPNLFKWLSNSDLEEAKHLYREYLGSFREVFIAYLIGLDVFHSRTSSNSHFALDLVILCHYPLYPETIEHYARCKIPAELPHISPASMMPEFRLYHHPLDLPLSVVYGDGHSYSYGYIELVSLISPLGDSQEQTKNGVLEELRGNFVKEVYAGAARCSLEFLCGVTDSDSLISSHQRFNSYVSFLRRNLPWKWRCNFGNRGSCRSRKYYRLVKPLAVLNDASTTYMYLSDTLKMRKRRSCPIYLYHFFTPSPLLDSKNTIVWDRVHSEKYLLALGYLIFCLPMAGESESLLQLCQTKAFSQRCCEYPKRTKKARRAIDDYVARMADMRKN